MACKLFNMQKFYFGDFGFLQKIKRQYDPDDVFYHPQGVRVQEMKLIQPLWRE